MLYPIYNQEGKDWDDCTYSVEYLGKTMDDIGMKGNWAYRDVASSQIFGLSPGKIKEICASADIFLNISSSTFLRDEYLKIPSRILVDTDPMFTQYDYIVKKQAGGDLGKQATDYLDAHTKLFTFGLNIDSPDCRIPT